MNTHFSLHKNRTLLSAYLSLLKVKHTARYADKLYNEHPYKYSLFGLSKMLSGYKIPNAGVEILNKEQGIKDLEPPFMAYAGNEFVLVYEKDDAKVSYLWQGKRVKVDMDYFQRIWSGVVLLAEPTAESVEPNYRQNRKWEWMERIKPFLLLMKQIHVQSRSADKLCSLFKKSDCNNILESKDAKLWGMISWSEIGFGYFCSNAVECKI